jgi:TctA family transporter
MRDDKRKENIKNPKIDLSSFIYANYKEILAVLIFIFCVLILTFSAKALENEKLSTVLITSISGSLGFLFGKKLS